MTRKTRIKNVEVGPAEGKEEFRPFRRTGAGTVTSKLQTWGTTMSAISRGEVMNFITRGWVAVAIPMLFTALPANAQDSSIYVQCPTDTGDTTGLHPDTDLDPTTREAGIKCMSLAAGDGMVTMADDAYVNWDGTIGGKKLYVFSFNKLKLPEQAIADGDITSESEYPTYVMNTGTMSANAPAPTIVVDEDDELFLSLTNVGMAMRPDLFDPHTVHWHGFPNASSVFDGVPDASISINMGATLTYYYNAKDAGTYMYHCHVEATEHMQMGMLGNLFVHPRQNNYADGTNVLTAFGTNAANTANGGLTPPPVIAPVGEAAVHHTGETYAYNDGDSSTQYNIEYPIQIGSFDPDFHDASFGVQPLPFASMHDRYFLLNGRGYPDTVDPAALSTDSPYDEAPRQSQPVSSLIRALPNNKILLRISNLNVTIFNTLATNGPPMKVVGLDARLLRDGAGNNMYYDTNSVTLGGGQSADVIIDTAGLSVGDTFFLYTTNLDRLANDAENFGGQMTEIRIVSSL